MGATVTAIIPTYNRRELVVQSALSVLGQSFTAVECLVIDNGSSDGTAEALRALGDERLAVLVRDQPLGAAKARNVGLAATRTPWVAFLDNDDLWAPTKLEHQLMVLTRYPSARWCATGCAYVGGDLSMRPGGRLNDGPLGPPDGQFFGSQDLLALLSRDNVIPGGGSSVLVSTELAQDAGGFHDDVPGCEDWDMWVRLARLSPMAYVDRPLAAWRMWEGQGSTDVPMMLRSANQVRLTYFPELGPVDDQYAQIWWASAARRYLAGRNRVQASKHFLHLGPTRPFARTVGVRAGRPGCPISGRASPPADRTSTGPAVECTSGAMAGAMVAPPRGRSHAVAKSNGSVACHQTTGSTAWEAPSPVTVYDAFLFSGEFDLLYLRVSELDPIVDYFMVVEATTTFQGEPRSVVPLESDPRLVPLSAQTASRSRRRSPSQNTTPWIAVEYVQRNALEPGDLVCRALN